MREASRQKTTLLKESVEAELSPRRFRHTMGVVETALALAKPFGLDPGRIETAALLHDICKEWSAEDLRKMVCQYFPGEMSEKDLESPEIMHGFAGAALAEHGYGIADPEILEAIKYHTVGKEGLSRFARVIYIADAVEPGRAYPEAAEIRRRVFADMDGGILYALRHMTAYLRQSGKYIHPNTEKMLAWLQAGRPDQNGSDPGNGGKHDQ